MESERVVVRGFLVVSSLPSKALLDTHLPEIFRGERIGSKEIKIVAGYFYNKLGSLARKFYDKILSEYAVNVGFGYIVPFDKAADFLREIDDLKKEYSVYEKQLKGFLLEGKIPEDLSKRAKKLAKIDVDYVKLVKEDLQNQGVSEDEWRRRVEKLNIIDRVRVNLIPFSLDYSIIEQYIDREARERVEREIENVKKEIVVSVKREIAEKAKIIINRITKLAESEIRRDILNSMSAEISELERKARELGVEIKELSVLREMISENKLKEIAIESTSGRLKALLEF